MGRLMGQRLDGMKNCLKNIYKKFKIFNIFRKKAFV